MAKNSVLKWNFFLGAGGAFIGLAVGLWAPFMWSFSDATNFIFLSSITAFVSLFLLILTGFFLFKMPWILKPISFLIFFSFLHFIQGIFYFLETFDQNGVIDSIRPYFEYDIFVLMPIFFALGFVPIIFSSFYQAYKNIFVKEKILKSGIKTSAKVISIRRSMIRLNKRTLYDVELQITTPQFGTYVKKISTPISLLEIDKYRVGQLIEVMVSQTNKNTVFVV